MERNWTLSYEEGVRPHLEYPDEPLYALLDRAAAKYPDKPAVAFLGKVLSFKALKDSVDRFANALAALGVSKGDRVGLLLPNCPQAVISYYGALKAGAVAVQNNPLYVERELAHQLRDSGSRTLVFLDLLWPRVERVRKEAGLENLIVTSIKDYLPFPLNLLYSLKQRREKSLVRIPPGHGVHRFTELLRGHPPEPPPVSIVPDEDLALLQYTGGTTGVSKGAMLTHKNLVANVLQVTEWFKECREGEERVLAALPYFHVYGMTCAMNFAVHMAGLQILLPRFEVAGVLKAIQKYKPTLFPGAPAMYVAVNNHPDVKKYDLSSITACISGAAPLPLEVQSRFEELTGGRLVEGYGLTEASPVTHCNPIFGKRKPGSIGLPVPDTEMKIVDIETGERELEPGQVGELAVRGPQVMKGYWNMPEESRLALRDGWLYTGDIARVDEDGYTFIVDRKKDMIIAGGYNIYPREVEEVLFEHPKIKEAAVAGIPDEYRGETVKAYIVPREGESLTEEEVLAFCRERLARYKVPTAVEFRTDLPKTMVGKVLRRALAESELDGR